MAGSAVSDGGEFSAMFAEPTIADRFRGFLPVVVDLETAGFNATTDALLEIAAIPIEMGEGGIVYPGEVIACAVEPFPGANLEESSLRFTGIDPDDPHRGALAEREALTAIFQPIRRQIRDQQCNRGVVVAHNAHFDLGFLNAAVERCNIKRNPFHPFSCIDTASLASVAYGQTVLARACDVAQIEFDNQKAHSAAYDALKTAELFCAIVNRWQQLGGWPPSSTP